MKIRPETRLKAWDIHRELTELQVIPYNHLQWKLTYCPYSYKWEACAGLTDSSGYHSYLRDEPELAIVNAFDGLRKDIKRCIEYLSGEILAFDGEENLTEDLVDRLREFRERRCILTSLDEKLQCFDEDLRDSSEVVIGGIPCLGCK